MKLAKTPRILFCLLLAAALVVSVGCTEPNADYNPNNGTGNNGVEDDTGGTGQQDAGSEDTWTGEDTGGSDDTGQVEQDTGTVEDVVDPDDTGQTEDTGGATCDLIGFTQSADVPAIVEGSNDWEFYAENGGGDQFVQLFLNNNSAQVGDVTFRDVSADQAENLLIMGDSCNDRGCRALYQAIGGTMKITEFDKTEGGAFSAKLIDVEFTEVTTDQDGNISRVQNGETWCVDDSELRAKAKPANDFPVHCDNTGFTAGGGRTVDYGDGALYAEAQTRRAEPHDILSLQIFSDFDGAATSPGTYQLDDPDYATCANCLLINVGCSQNQGGCTKTFIAGAGTLEVTNTGGVGDKFTATVKNARLAEVDINRETYETTRVQDGEGWCISSFSWDMRISSVR